MTALQDAQQAFLDEILAAGHYLPLGRTGVWGRSDELEQVVLGFVRLLDGFYATRPQQRVHFGPLVPQPLLESTGYVDTQPHLVGSIDAFYGDDHAHRHLVADREEGRDWRRHLEPAGLMMVSSACHPLYGALSGQQVNGNYLVLGWVFRHEPSGDPYRVAYFRQKESVHVGSHQECVDHRDHWVHRAEDLLTGLGLPVHLELANDPFFGRAGRMMARGQRAAALKKELLVDAYGADLPPVALASGNLHGDHFTHAFGIRQADGSDAETACMGFGLERVALSLFKVHGMQTSGWPGEVRSQLGL
ncbi:hypothetical protein [Arsenicicoccus dermatophilus]|uniref:hypothetical protein n=1 Tax=Arsenicicoccus dermatophilus TaxID=1076331 RepID=UPI001F4D2D29|nr:hypothetical protein [Arsenicicoccus dermatophilus]MCH8612117.1 hypothetical protein [Arsenicicoccus dermatophilus]